ncbi:hypothetical protein ACFYUD_36275 [Nocardia tengchongensis]|uniref:hypothetical protein n=1 Tax=Nocardia tengchongensis TaxID=2055889 RepID=UPI0036C0496F
MIYEERYGFNPKTILLLLGAAVFVAGAILTPDVSPGLRIAAILLFGVGGLLVLANALTRKVALRVDPTGITLGGPPLRYRTTTQRIPWSDIEAVVLWWQRTPSGRHPWIGILRRIDAPPLQGWPTGSTGQSLLSAATALGGAPDQRLMQCARGINAWKIDMTRLEAALQTLAPQVKLNDHR